jgi:hypothetical protein
MNCDDRRTVAHLFIEYLSMAVVNRKWLVQVVIMNQEGVAFRCKRANIMKVGEPEL